MALAGLIQVLALLITILAVATKKGWIDLLDGFFIVWFTVGILRILIELSAKYDVTLQTLLLICYAITMFIRHAKRQCRFIQPLFSSRQGFFKEFPVAVSL